MPKRSAMAARKSASPSSGAVVSVCFDLTERINTMFMIYMPTNFRVGDSAACRINRKPQRVTWRDQNTLVIEPDDARQIFHTETDGKLRCFMCGDAGAKKASVFRSPDGVVVRQDD